MVWTRKNSKLNRYETPIVDFLSSNSKYLDVNFHALPIYHMNSGTKGYDKYKKLFGDKYFSLETTITGKIFDSFFYPTKAIKRSQNFAAEAFGSKDTIFVTCGTTIANYIAVDALIDENSNVLVDRSAHQSIHFSIKEKRANFDYFYNNSFCKFTERNYISLPDIMEKVENAKNCNKPYDVMVISASSYDGVICNIYEIIKNIIKISPNIKFLIDEAWSSAFYFHPRTYKYTAGFAAKKLGDNVNIVSTQSAHKSLMASRQGSLIHSFSSEEITNKLYKSRFKYHSTSPSYPILASLDLARAQMQCCGRELLENAFKCKNLFEGIISEDKKLQQFQFKHKLANIDKLSGGICTVDPLKVHINISHLNMKGSDFQEYLYNNYGLYFNRYTDHSVLLNIHIGIKKDHIDKMTKAMKLIKSIDESKNTFNACFDNFIIPYPPGIPLYAPGEKIDQDSMFLEINNKIKNGISVFQVS